MIDVGQRRQRVDRLAVQQNVEFGQLARFVTGLVIIERCVTARNAFQLIVKIEHDFGQRHVEIDLDTILRDENLVEQRSPLVDTEFDNAAEKLGFRNDLSENIGLFDRTDQRSSGSPDGLCTSITSPLLVCTLYDTFGTVVMTSILNSRYRRS